MTLDSSISSGRLGEMTPQDSEERSEPRYDKGNDAEHISLISDDGNNLSDENTLKIGYNNEQKGKNNCSLRAPFYGIHSKWYVWFLTYLAAIIIHANRKGYSSVKSTIADENWFQGPSSTGSDKEGNTTTEEELSEVDFMFLFIYALGVLFFGHIGDKFDMRLLLSAGLASSGVMLILFAMGKYWNIHSLSYYFVVYGINGLSQGGSWPMGVACIANWFPKSQNQQNLALAVWSTSASMGNVTGSLIAALIFTLYGPSRASEAWPVVLSAIGILCVLVAAIMYFTLLPRPCPNDNHLKNLQTVGTMSKIKSRVTKNNIKQTKQKYEVIPSSINSPSGAVESLSSGKNLAFDTPKTKSGEINITKDNEYWYGDTEEIVDLSLSSENKKKGNYNVISKVYTTTYN